jgi:hypothetical protein
MNESLTPIELDFKKASKSEATDKARSLKTFTSYSFAYWFQLLLFVSLLLL